MAQRQLVGCTHLGLAPLVHPPAQHKDGDVMLGRPEDVVGQPDHLLGPHGQARLLERLPLGAGEVALSNLEVAAGELPLAWAEHGLVSEPGPAASRTRPLSVSASDVSHFEAARPMRAARLHLKQNRRPPTSAMWALANSHDHSALRVANNRCDPDADHRGGLCRHAVVCGPVQCLTRPVLGPETMVGDGGRPVRVFG